MKQQIKCGVIALLTFVGVAAMPALASAKETSTRVTGMTCSVNNYGNYSCVPKEEVTVRKRTISYVDTKVTSLKFLDTAMSASTKVALGSIFALGLLGLVVKFTRLAK